MIGRATDVDLRISDSSVSRRHARVDVTSVGRTPELTVTDLDSSNGTFVNGRLIQAVQGFRSGDILSFGDADLHIEGIT